jgi:hypothetical protein
MWSAVALVTVVQLATLWFSDSKAVLAMAVLGTPSWSRATMRWRMGLRS